MITHTGPCTSARLIGSDYCQVQSGHQTGFVAQGCSQSPNTSLSLPLSVFLFLCVCVMNGSGVSPSYASHVSHRNNKISAFTRETEVERERARESSCFPRNHDGILQRSVAKTTARRLRNGHSRLSGDSVSSSGPNTNTATPPLPLPRCRLTEEQLCALGGKLSNL